MAKELLLFIGTLNREAPYFQGARGDGLHVVAFDEETLGFRRLAHYPQVENPTYLSVTPDGRHIYVNSEVADWREGLVTAFSFEPSTASLIYLNTQPSLGSITAHNMISRDGKRLFVANYTVGEGGPDQSFAVFDIRSDGSISPACASVAHQGTGPNPERQERAHAHSATEVIQGGMVIVADLGTDELVTYRIEADGTPNRIAVAKTEPGAGPRHLALHPKGELVFVINELNSTISSHRLDPVSGILTASDICPALSSEEQVGNHCSDLQISPDGRFLYGGNRGHDSVSIIEIDQETGKLRYLDTVSCGGETPRHMALTPSGQHLLVANQNSDRVSILARDMRSGGLSDTGHSIPMGTPMCLKFAC